MTSRTRLLASCIVLTGLALAPSTGLAVTLDPGDIVIFDTGFGNRRVVHVDGVTGNQTIFPVNFGATTMHLSEDGQHILINSDDVVSLDPTTGLVTTIASGGLITGTPRGMDLEEDGDIVIGQYSSHSLIRIDAVTGAMENLSVPLGSTNGVAVDAAGDIFVGPELFQRIVRVAPDGTIIQEYSMGSGFGRPYDIHFRPNGELVVLGNHRDIYILNPDGGGVTELISDEDDVFTQMGWGGFVTQDDRILVPGQLTGESFRAIYEVDPVTGDVTLFASGGAIQQPVEVLVVETQPCDDGVDNDGDSFIDLADPECNDANDLSEEANCDDGLDNDFDGSVDLGDPGCSGAGDLSERDAGLACDDGVDGDSDGEIDFPDDPGCDDSLDPDEKSALIVCDDGLDNDGDGLIDVPDDPGCEAPGAASEQLADLACDDGEDNDFDGLVDLDDPACEDVFSPIENPQCDDEIDNDGDLMVDWDGGQFGLTPDSQCLLPWGDSESVQQSCGLGAEGALALVALAGLRTLRRRTRGRRS